MKNFENLKFIGVELHIFEILKKFAIDTPYFCCYTNCRSKKNEERN